METRAASLELMMPPVEILWVFTAPEQRILQRDPRNTTWNVTITARSLQTGTDALVTIFCSRSNCRQSSSCVGSTGKTPALATGSDMQLSKGKQHSSLYTTNAEKGNPPFRSYLESVEPGSLGGNYALTSPPVINMVVVINIQREHQSNKAGIYLLACFLL